MPSDFARDSILMREKRLADFPGAGHRNGLPSGIENICLPSTLWPRSVAHLKHSYLYGSLLSFLTSIQTTCLIQIYVPLSTLHHERIFFSFAPAMYQDYFHGFCFSWTRTHPFINQFGLLPLAHISCPEMYKLLM
jgi:hypothetical protein